MKYIIILATIIFSLPSWAITECGGSADDGSWVLLHVETTGATGVPSEGTMTIENGGNKYGYRFTHAEIAQFFENDDASNNSAMVGIAAYVANEDPVSVKYIGKNFVDMDLKTVVAEGDVNSVTGNFLRVWKGPGHASSDQIQITKFACSVWSNL